MNKTKLDPIRTVLGIDVSKDKFDVAVMVNHEIVDQFVLPMDALGLNELGDYLDNISAPEVIYEATGVYSRSLDYFLRSKNIHFVRINPLQAKKEMDGLRVNKTDPNDARRLAETQIRLSHFKMYQQDPVYGELRDHHRLYQQIVGDMVVSLNRLKGSLQVSFRGLEKLMDTNGPTFWTIAKTFPYPDAVKECDTETIMQVFKDGANNRMSKKRSLELTQKLQELSITSYCATSKDSGVIHAVLRSAKDLLRQHDEQKRVLKDMRKAAEELPEYAILCSIPGISDVTAFGIIGEIGDLRRFKNANQVNAFIGIDVKHSESGKSKGKDHITKRGNTYARKVLYRAIMNIASIARYQNNHINDFYTNKKKSFPNDTKRIAIASMSRLIRTIYHLIMKNETYDYEIASHAIR